MCGIVGYIGNDNCIPKILYGLECLEYRGYDSAGLAYKKDNKIIIKKAKGRLSNLKDTISKSEISTLGIGHTRWATHGEPSKINCHPHQVKQITLIHNGIIENYKELKDQLDTYNFISETDTEVLCAFIDYLYSKEKDILKVLSSLKYYIKGSYALGIIVDGDDKLYAIRHESPLIIGLGDNGNFIASDVPAILKYTNKYMLLFNDEFGVLSRDAVTIYNETGAVIKKECLTFTGASDTAMKNGYEHFMLKEIYEQPKVIKDTISEYVSSFTNLESAFAFIKDFTAIDIIGCGSAYHVGLVGKTLIEKYRKIPVNVEVASEYRYKEHLYGDNHLIILISQSGETADTLAVLRKAKEEGINTYAIVNVVGSSIAREADKVTYIKAGSEIAVATTKAYSCQMMILSLIAAYLGINNKILDETILKDYQNINTLLEDVLNNTEDTKKVAELIYNHKDVFFLGRKLDYALCLEASLKLKEISYIHSEAYPAGELKHGTISLIEEGIPCISIITDDEIKLKTLSNIKEVCARGALSIIITNQEIEDKDTYQAIISIPQGSDLITSVFAIIKCQLIAYYTAKLNGCDIDKPRNLAKSVTVE